MNIMRTNQGQQPLPAVFFRSHIMPNRTTAEKRRSNVCTNEAPPLSKTIKGTTLITRTGLQDSELPTKPCKEVPYSQKPQHTYRQNNHNPWGAKHIPSSQPTVEGQLKLMIVPSHCKRSASNN
jgi:hypothetical protein